VAGCAAGLGGAGLAQHPGWLGLMVGVGRALPGLILLGSATGMGPPQIARLVPSDESQVRLVIHEFNSFGFESLPPPLGAGGPAW
jgi:hypothetical protein